MICTRWTIYTMCICHTPYLTSLSCSVSEYSMVRATEYVFRLSCSSLSAELCTDCSGKQTIIIMDSLVLRLFPTCDVDE